jgi:hypothetical protein
MRRLVLPTQALATAMATEVHHPPRMSALVAERHKAATAAMYSATTLAGST